MKKVTAYQLRQAVGTTGDELADDLCAAFDAASESDKNALRSQHPDIFTEQLFDLDPDEPAAPPPPDNFL